MTAKQESVSEKAARRTGIERVIQAERLRQDEKWGWPQSNSLTEWSAILGEEYGETCEQILRVHFAGKPMDELVEETVQVAAVAFAMLESWSEEGLISLD